MENKKLNIIENPEYDWGPENDNLSFEQYSDWSLEDIDKELEQLEKINLISLEKQK
ncbi:hypothetical protein ACFQOY_03415 [Enterococcus alcedinis]|uniref:hypothetical protein n=1 Tax=Enterococcus alcedinis TaxID=1274384 RepID=UPI001668DAC5|nr:hypothetical protein [Enterococcus alcedinis]MBP2102728.1 hypothetical protein [Enterococcus alcedinis]